jgi:hypothetical protein
MMSSGYIEINARRGDVRAMKWLSVKGKFMDNNKGVIGVYPLLIPLLKTFAGNQN